MLCEVSDKVNKHYDLMKTQTYTQVTLTSKTRQKLALARYVTN